MKNQDHQPNHGKPFKMVFFGTSDFAVPILNTLMTSAGSITAVVTQPDKPAGRKKILKPPPIKLTADKHNLKIFQPKTLKDDLFFEVFKNLEPDICILASYGKIIPERYLAVPKYGFVNVHPSLLPKYRGPSPIQTAILNGENETGVTIMLMDKEVDHGPILATTNYQLPTTKNFKEVESELAKLGAELLNKTLPKYISGELRPREQDHSKATFTKILTREDGKINWNMTAEEINNQIRALNSEPGTWTIWENKILNIISAHAECSKLPSSKTDIGKIIKTNGGIGVITGKCFLILEEIQLEGSKKNNIKDFTNGHLTFIESRLG